MERITMTTTTTHTPGPWKSTYNGGVHQIIPADQWDNETPDVVAEAWGDHDARLIAAAPALLDALRAALDTFEEIESDKMMDAMLGGTVTGIHAVAEQARAAIAAATGEDA